MRKLFKLGVLLLLGYLILSYFLGELTPSIESLRSDNPKRTAYMGEASRPVSQYWVPLSQMSPYLRQATIVAEDAAFYQHHGIDFHELKESIKKNVKEFSFARGFSTISMQLARNLYLAPNKNLSRKFKEIVIALALERKLTKHRILELYLNLIEWGRGHYGAEAAARHYFDKSASDLTRDQAAFLAAIIPSPQRFGRLPPTPYIQTRIDVILKRMATRWPEKAKSDVAIPESS